MMSKRWLALVGFIVSLCFLDTIGIVVTRVTPTRFADISSPDCVPNWAIMHRIILEVFSPYVKLVMYIGFLSLFVRQCK